MSQLELNIPEKLAPIFDSARYKVFFGGRGSSKSWTIAQYLVLKAYQQPTRVLCCREMQRSISDSVLQLLSDTIDRMGLNAHFEVQSQQILGKNGSRFIFEGLKANITKIKSMEGIDIVWAEEAESITHTSWTTLIPTIRKDDSQIIVSFNPRDELDETYQRFVINPPPDTISVEINYPDNPWFPDVLKKEMLQLKETNHDLYEHIWLGKCFYNREGAYYAKYINDKQIVNIPVERTLKVSTYWDIGVNDATAIWMVQNIGLELRVVNYYENSGEGLDHYIRYLDEWAKENHVIYNRHYAPHDIRVRELSTGKSRLQTALQMGIRFDITPSLSIEDGIHAARQIIPRCWFDAERCKIGLRNLRNYRKEFDEVKGVYKNKPLHDYTSNGADAFRYFAINWRDVRVQQQQPIQARGFNAI